MEGLGSQEDRGDKLLRAGIIRLSELCSTFSEIIRHHPSFSDLNFNCISQFLFNFPVGVHTEESFHMHHVHISICTISRDKRCTIQNQLLDNESGFFFLRNFQYNNRTVCFLILSNLKFR